MLAGRTGVFVSLICWIGGIAALFRLPESVSPRNYQVTLIPVMERDERLCGHVWIDIDVHHPTKEIVLHAANLVLQQIVVVPTDDDQGDVISLVEELCFSGVQDSQQVSLPGDLVESFQLNATHEVVTIHLTEELHPEDHYRIGCLYTGLVNDDKGFFRKSYTRNQDDCCQRWIGATQLEAVHARKVLPCFDEPHFKASFQLRIGHASAMKAISNMPVESSAQMKSVENWIWDTFETTPAMPTYILAFVVTELEFLETHYRSIDGRNVTLRMWTNGHKLGQLNLAMTLVPRLLTVLEEYLQVPYALPKLDMIAIPGYDSARAMENWGLIVHSESNLLSETKMLTPIDRTLVAITMAHELAHQWFGNLVTSRWWDDIWVNEGLATLFENIILYEVAPELDVDEVTVLFYQQALNHDHVSNSNPLNYPVALLPSIEDKFDGFAYVKGSALFKMLRSFVGEHAFRSALHRYFTQFRYGNAQSTDLWVLMNQEARRNQTISGRMNIFRIMKTWTHQPGYPVITVERKDDIIRFSQTPFIDAEHPLNLTEGNDYDSTCGWWVPISMTHAQDPQFGLKATLPVAWLSPKRPSTEISDPVSRNDSWIVVNIESTGYYRVNYDLHNWELLARQLAVNHTVIPPMTRSQLIDDAFVFAHSRMLPYDVAFKMINYMGKAEELDYIRKMAHGHVSRIHSAISLNSLDGQVDHHMQDTVRRVLEYVSHEGRSRFARTGRAKTNLFAFCFVTDDDKPCVSEASRLFHALMNRSITTEETKMMSQYFEEIWCAALRNGSSSEWEFAWQNSFPSSASATERRKILKAMSCTVNPGQTKQLLARIFHPNIIQKPKDTSLILSSLAKNPSARPFVLNFILMNWEFLNKHFQSSLTTIDLLTDLATSSSLSLEENEKVTAFLTKLDPETSARICSSKSSRSGRWLDSVGIELPVEIVPPFPRIKKAA